MGDVINFEERKSDKKTDEFLKSVTENQKDLMELFEVLLDGLDLFSPRGRDFLFNGPSRSGGYWEVRISHKPDETPSA